MKICIHGLMMAGLGAGLGIGMMPSARAQSPEIEWIRQFGTAHYDFVHAAAADSSGVYVVGDMGSSSLLYAYAFVQKHDRDGNLIWTAGFSCPGFDDNIMNTVAVDSSGVYVGGRAGGAVSGQPFIGGGHDAVLQQYDHDGNEVWTREFGTPWREEVAAIALSPDAVYVAGQTEGALPGQTHGGSYDAFVRRYDKDGNERWTRQWSAQWNDSWGGIAVDSTGIYVVGNASGTSWDHPMATVCKYAHDGTELWTRQLGDPGAQNVGNGIAVDGTGLYLHGSTVGTLPGQLSSGGHDNFIARLDTDGNLIWVQQYGTPANDAAGNLVLDATGLYVDAYTQGAFPGQVSAGANDVAVLKWDRDHNLLWALQFGTSANDWMGHGLALAGSDLYVGGVTYGNLGPTPAGDLDAYLAKLALPPSITQHPVIQTVPLGDTATFHVSATGTEPLSYQWKFDGVDLVGKTAETLVVANARLGQASTYTVVVGNSVGTVTSAPAVLNLTAAAWSAIAIPGVPAATSMGGLWTPIRGVVFVWVNRDWGSGQVEGRLYRSLNGGASWRIVLVSPNVRGEDVWGTGMAEMYASAGGAGIWRSVDGGENWILQSLPYMPTTIYSFCGFPNDVQVVAWDGSSVGYSWRILRFDGTSWTLVWNSGENITLVRPDEGYYSNGNSWGKWNGTIWHHEGYQGYKHTYSVWGTRDPSGTLHLYEGGSLPGYGPPKIWRFNESTRQFVEVFSDPVGSRGIAGALWGSGATDVWALTLMGLGDPSNQQGRIYHCDGNTWSPVTTPFAPLPWFMSAWRSIWGTAPNDVWIACSGRLLHYASMPPQPEAGPDARIPRCQQSSTLIVGSASDPDGDPLWYRWLEGGTELLSWTSTSPDGGCPLDLGVLPYFSLGLHALTLEVNDGHSMAQDTMALTVDNCPPVARCNSVTVSAGADCTANASADVGSYDPDDGDTITLTQSPPGPYPLGQTTVTLTVTDNHGASDAGTAIVTVEDHTKPILACPADIALSCSLDLHVPVEFYAAATDNCDPAPTVVCTPASGSGFPVGTTTVFCTATDASGNTASGSFTVTRAPLSFTGFLPPLGGADAIGGNFATPLRTFKLGSTIPVKFSAACQGAPVLTGVHRLLVQQCTSQNTCGDPIKATSQDAATEGNRFRLVDNCWQFNLDTRGTRMSVGIWRIAATLSDGSTHEAWIQLK